MRRRIKGKKEMVARLSVKENESPSIKIYETHYERLDEKQKYIELREIINDHDPVFLFMLGYVEDEYEGEVNMINKGLFAGMNRGQVHDLVCEVFEDRFGISCRKESSLMNKERYEYLANDIFSWMNYGNL